MTWFAGQASLSSFKTIKDSANQPLLILIMAEIVKLHGIFYSPFLFRVIWALKIKGIPYEYVDEDLLNKSPLLLKYNPVHKRVPVLVHGGNPVSESLVIMEYIEEMWPQNPLLQTDPYEKQLARFWIKFVDEKSLSIWKMIRAVEEEEQEQAKKGVLEMLQILEDEAFADEKLFKGDDIGMVDIVLGASMVWLEVIQEVAGVTVLDADKFPRLREWNKNFREVDAIKENFPDCEKILVFIKNRREAFC